MNDWEIKDSVLKSPFDVETHKKTFINYLEVVITPKGKIEYAIPSHTEFLINYYMKKLEFKSRLEVFDVIPKEYHYNCLEWLLEQTECICVWNDTIMGVPNDVQIKKLIELKINELYRGNVDKYLEKIW